MRSLLFLGAFLLIFPLYAGSLDDVENWINGKREGEGLMPLEKERQLELSARSYAADLSGRGIITHRDREGRGPWERYGLAGGTALAAGEILGTSSADVPLGDIFDAWWASPPHREQIMNPRWTCMGVAIRERGNVRIVAVEFSSTLLGDYRLYVEEGETVLDFEPLSFIDTLFIKNVLKKTLFTWKRGEKMSLTFEKNAFPLMLEVYGAGESGPLKRGNRFVFAAPPSESLSSETDRAASGP